MPYHYQTHTATRKVSTEYGTYHFCEECWTNHPVPKEFLKSEHTEDSDGRPCECEHISHFNTKES